MAEEKLRASVSEHIGASDARLIVTAADDIGEAMMMQAQAENVDLIVMRSKTSSASRGTVGPRRSQFAETLHVPCLLCITMSRSLSATSLLESETMLVAYDFSDYSELALKYGLSIARSIRPKWIWCTCCHRAH